MNFRYFILSTILVPSIAHTMEQETPAQKSKPQEKLQIISLAPKHVSPVVTHISSLTQKITFNGKTKSLFRWLKHKEKNKFDDTPIVEMHQLIPHGVTFTKRGNVYCIDHSIALANMLANQKAIYISNIEKKYFSDKQHIRYGTLLFWDNLNKEPNFVTPERVARAANHFLIWIMEQEQAQKAVEKKKKELAASTAEFFEEAEKVLGSVEFLKR